LSSIIRRPLFWAKALFWDEQAGSDGLACASCHFQAGADNRVKNQLSPGLRNQQGPPVSQRFNMTGSNQSGGPNYTLKKSDYPFHQLADPNDRDATQPGGPGSRK
jgi:cytochrome c peroxidase